MPHENNPVLSVEYIENRNGWLRQVESTYTSTYMPNSPWEALQNQASIVAAPGAIYADPVSVPRLKYTKKNNRRTRRACGRWANYEFRKRSKSLKKMGRKMKKPDWSVDVGEVEF